MRWLCKILPHRWARVPGYGDLNIRYCRRCGVNGWVIA